MGKTLDKTTNRLFLDACGIAASLIEKSDLEAFWGDEIYDAALNDATGRELRRLRDAQDHVVVNLRGKSAATVPRKKR